MELVLEAHGKVAEDSELVVLEGAGSCTELNLMERDVVELAIGSEAQLLHGCLWPILIPLHESDRVAWISSDSKRSRVVARIALAWFH
jgi:hypothetical protein